MKSTAFLLCSALIFAALAMAQAGASTSFDATDTKYEDSLQRLEDASQAFPREDRAAVMEHLRVEETTIAQADQDFDSTVSDLEEIQTRGDPDGEFVAFVNDMRLRARDQASKAERDNDTASRDAFLAIADSFEAVLDSAIEAYDGAIPAIEFIPENKRTDVR